MAGCIVKSHVVIRAIAIPPRCSLLFLPSSVKPSYTHLRQCLLLTLSLFLSFSLYMYVASIALRCSIDIVWTNAVRNICATSVFDSRNHFSLIFLSWFFTSRDNFQTLQSILRTASDSHFYKNQHYHYHIYALVKRAFRVSQTTFGRVSLNYLRLFCRSSSRFSSRDNKNWASARGQHRFDFYPAAIKYYPSIYFSTQPTS